MIRKTAVMEIIKAHMDGEDKNTKAVLSDVMDSVNELETLEQEPCDECRNKRTSFCGNCKEYDEYEPCDKAISCSDMLDAIGHGTTYTSEELQKIITNLPPVTQKSGKWITVSERLPEVGISVLVSDVDSDIYFTHITRDGVFFDEWGNKIKGIVAWMPLPEPYEPQESEEQTE